MLAVAMRSVLQVDIKTGVIRRNLQKGNKVVFSLTTIIG